MEAAEVLEMLADHKFLINLFKSAVILKVTGAKQHAFARNYVSRRQDGVFLTCRAPSGAEVEVPIVRTRGYLGATISYGNFERATLDRRLQVAEHAYKRLKPVLGCRRGVPLALRVQVYQVCVVTTLHFAIFAAGFGEQEVTRIHRTLMRHLRCIALSPRHITHETNQNLCWRLEKDTPRLEKDTPAGELERVWTAKSEAWQQRRERLKTPPYPSFMSGQKAQCAAGLAE